MSALFDKPIPAWAKLVARYKGFLAQRLAASSGPPFRRTAAKARPAPPCSLPQILEELRRRADPSHKQVIARPRTSHIEEVTFRLVHVLQI